MQYLDPAYMLCLYCVNTFQLPFYIYYYIYTGKSVVFVYSLLIQIPREYKRAALHSSEEQMYSSKKIAERWKISLLDKWKK
jgi:hypothetical protein